MRVKIFIGVALVPVIVGLVVTLYGGFRPSPPPNAETLRILSLFLFLATVFIALTLYALYRVTWVVFRLTLSAIAGLLIYYDISLILHIPTQYSFLGDWGDWLIAYTSLFYFRLCGLSSAVTHLFVPDYEPDLEGIVFSVPKAQDLGEVIDSGIVIVFWTMLFAVLCFRFVRRSCQPASAS
jgi:hypothetical protein